MSMLRRVFRGVREHLYFFSVSTGVIAAALVLLGLFALVVRDVDGMVATWQADQHVSAYFAPGVTAETEQAVRAAVAQRPEVARVELVTAPEAAAWMVERAPDLDPVLKELGPDALPASLEITLKADRTEPAQIAAFVEALKADGGWEDVDYGQEWVTRIHTFLSLLTALGVAFGIATVVATLFLVANTIHLVVHARQDELEILRLVGANETYILLPFLAEGVLQGLIGSSIATSVLYGIHAGLLVRLHDLLALAMGEPPSFLPGAQILVLLVLGVALGTGASWAAVRRFLASLP